MIWLVYCGLTDWNVPIEAATENEAIELGRAVFIERFQECQTYFARTSGAAK